MGIGLINRRSHFPNINRHSHNGWEIILTAQGTGAIMVEDQKYSFQPGSIICVPPHQMHYNIEKNSLTHIYMRVNDFISPFHDEKPIWLLDDEEKSFETLMLLALRIFYKKSPNYGEVLDCIYKTLYQLLLSWVQASAKVNEIETFKNHLIANFTDPEFQLSNALSRVPYSVDHFRKRFKSDTGMTPASYLMHLKIEYAKKLLANQTHSQARISEIALRSGFYDAHYFSRMFKKLVGCTPQHYLSSQHEND